MCISMALEMMDCRSQHGSDGDEKRPEGGESRTPAKFWRWWSGGGRMDQPRPALPALALGGGRVPCARA